jgi:hypothetical protein
LIGWAIATGTALLVLYGLYDDMNGERLSTDVAALYNTVHRTIWGACVAWVIFACATGYGGKQLNCRISTLFYKTNILRKHKLNTKLNLFHPKHDTMIVLL